MSPVYIGSTKISNGHLGSTAIRSIHRGTGSNTDVIVWPEIATYTMEFTTLGAFNHTVPWWASKVEIVLIGGGGSGCVGGSLQAGAGGQAASWAGRAWNAQAFLAGGPVPANMALTGFVGKGGDSVPGGGLAPTTAGTYPTRYDGVDSSVTFQGQTTTAAGGRNLRGGAGVLIPALGGTAVQPGYAPGNYSFGGVTYVGGMGGDPATISSYDVNRAKGGVPGAGGAGSWGVALGAGATSGAGGDGKVWIKVYAP